VSIFVVILFMSFTRDRLDHVCMVTLLTFFTGDRRDYVCIVILKKDIQHNG
jgi:hypothetical protein